MAHSTLSRSARWLVFGAGALVALTPAGLFGFAEDACVIVSKAAPKKGRVLNCYELHCNDDLEFGSFNRARCTARQVAEAGLAAMEILPIRGRSTVHFDATYIIAQSLGMSGPDAYWLAAYDQATDQGTFEPIDRNGDPIPAYMTVDLPGVDRLNFPQGGTFFHYVPPTAVTQVLDSIDIHSPVEAPLNHIRSWAFEERKELCRFGLASKPFTNEPGCLSLPDQLNPIFFRFNYTDDAGSKGIDQNIASGEVQVTRDGRLPEATAPLLKMGVYLHALADRISHHGCCDGAPLVREADGRFSVRFAQSCGQGTHASQHALEIGHPDLPPRTHLALEKTWDELDAWLTAHPKWRTGKPTSRTRAQVLEEVINALKPPKAADRIQAFRNIWAKDGLCGLPGDEAPDRICFPDVKVVYKKQFRWFWEEE